MQAARILIAAGCVLLALAGCTIAQPVGEPVRVKWNIFGAIVDALLGCDDDRRDTGNSDGLWRQGYGFKNPNVERRQQGLPPLNFDGSVHNP